MLLLRALQSIGRLINSVHWLRPGRLRGTRDLGDAQPTVVGGREQRMGTGSATAYRYATEESGAIYGYETGSRTRISAHGESASGPGRGSPVKSPKPVDRREPSRCHLSRASFASVRMLARDLRLSCFHPSHRPLGDACAYHIITGSDAGWGNNI